MSARGDRRPTRPAPHQPRGPADTEPPTRAIRDDVVQFKPGDLDPNTPFDQFLAEQIAVTDRVLSGMGAPPASARRWRDTQRWAAGQTAKVRRVAAILANFSAWAQDALTELDPNQKLHKAFQAGRELQAGIAVASIGEAASKGQASLGGSNRGAVARQRTDRAAVLEQMRRLIEDKGFNPTDAGRRVFEDPRRSLGASAIANRSLWLREVAKRK